MPYVTEDRQMTEDERRLLTKWLTPIPLILLGGFDFQVFLIGLVLYVVIAASYGIVAGVLVLYIAPFFSYHFTFMQTGPICIGLGAISGVGFTIYRFCLVKMPLHDHPEDLARNHVEVTHYTASEVAQIERSDPNDVNHADGYAFQIEPDKMLLVGRLVLDEKDISEGRFPCRTFDVVRLPNKGRFLGATCTGQPITPIRTICVPDDQICFKGTTRYLTGTLDQLEALLPRLQPEQENW